MGHNWSGWPGAYCLKCGAEQALENAIGMNWVDIDTEGEDDKWKSVVHKEFVELCDKFCPADMTKEEQIEHSGKLEIADKAVKDIDENYK